MNIPPEISVSKALLFFCDNLDAERQWGKAVDALKEMDHMQKAQAWTLMANKAAVNNNNNNAVLSKYKCAYKRAVCEAEEEGMGGRSFAGGGGGGNLSGHIDLTGHGGSFLGHLDLSKIEKALERSIKLCELLGEAYDEVMETRHSLEEHMKLKVGNGVVSDMMGLGGGISSNGLNAEFDRGVQSLQARIDDIDLKFEKLDGVDTSLVSRMDKLDRECKTRGDSDELKFSELGGVHMLMASRMDKYDAECTETRSRDALKFSELEGVDTRLAGRMDQFDAECTATGHRDALKFSELEGVDTRLAGRMDQYDAECTATRRT